jgi:hypothetical protein
MFFLTLSKVDGLYSIQTTVPFISCIYQLMNYEQKILSSDVNNSTNINKMNNNLSSQLAEHKKIPQHMTLEIKVLAWDKHKNMGGLNWSLGSQPSPLDNWISNVNTLSVKSSLEFVLYLLFYMPTLNKTYLILPYIIQMYKKK